MVLYAPGRTSSYPENPPKKGLRYHYLGGGDEVGVDVDDVGDDVGAAVGQIHSQSVGESVGESVGVSVGDSVGVLLKHTSVILQ